MNSFSRFLVVLFFLFCSFCTPALFADSDGKYVLSSLKDAEAKLEYRKAISLLDDGQIYHALTTLNAALKREPDNAQLLSKTGLLAIDSGDSWLKTARSCLEKLYKVNEKNLTSDEVIAYSRSLFMVEPLKLVDSEKLLNEVLTKEPENISAQIALAELELMKARFQNALDLFNKAKPKKPLEPRIAWGIGYAYLGMGYREKAMFAFLDAYSLTPKSATNCEKMGKAMLDLGKPMMAKTYFSTAINIDPNSVEGHLGVAAIQLVSNEDASAIWHLRKVLDLDPQNPRLYLYRGIYNEMRQNLTEAIEDYRLAASLGGNMAEAKLRLAKIYAGVGHAFPGGIFSNETAEGQAIYRQYANVNEAITLLNEVIQLAPNHPEISYIKALLKSLED
ncbi:MAG: hypothetical protein HQM10_11830 [Candidatus Riflebacteria bacterium]|nr:hypothetical protein [Candidatus Riflebacteria bacterium]